MILLMLACVGAPYPEYWPDKSAYPAISRLEPDTIDSRGGGQLLVIEGKRLSTARTVVIGGRNAKIASADDRAVTVWMPSLPAGPDKLAVSVVTGDGYATREGALRVSTEGSVFWKDEIASAALLRVDCPIEGWGTFPDGEAYPFGWCGADMGYASAEAWLGAGAQAGFAGEIGGITPLSQAPPVGEVRVFKPGDRVPPAVPMVYAAHGLEEEIQIRTDRDFARDLAFLEERQELLEQTYYWADSISDWTGPHAVLFDDEECWLGDLDVIAASGSELDVDGDAAGAIGLWMGFGIEEEYEDFTYTDEATTSTAYIADVQGETIVGDSSGVDMYYDDYSGWFGAWGVAGVVGPADLPSGAEYTVATVDVSGNTTNRGSIPGGETLDLWETWPDLTLGDAEIDLDSALEIAWIPASDTENPTFLVVEIAVYDTDIDDPNWQTQVTRVVARGDDAVGTLTLSPEQLQALPVAPNAWDENGDFTGYWGEMTISRHQLRKVQVEGGDLVVDFIHAINGPAALLRAD